MNKKKVNLFFYTVKDWIIENIFIICHAKKIVGNKFYDKKQDNFFIV